MRSRGSRDLPVPASGELLAQRCGGGIDRRTFLARMSALLGAAALPERVLAAAGLELPPAYATTMAAVQAHLFPPTPGAPGAQDINATAYLLSVLADPLVEAQEKRFLADGGGWLDAYSRRRFDSPFADLDAERRETLLRRVEQDPPGRDWIALVLYYLLEALLTDPLYGGNPGGIGWRWLGHQPGFPRPQPGKRYFELG